MERRNFLRLSGLFSVAALAGPACSGKRAGTPLGAAEGPVVISTWDFGQAANAEAWKVLEQDGAALDAVEQGTRQAEADPDNPTVGFGGRPDRDGKVTLDACIMDAQGRCGSVAALEQIMHPISVARMVMEKTPHIMLAGTGALQFALENGFKQEDLLTPKSRRDWEEWLKDSEYRPVPNIENAAPGQAPDHDTIGMLALDAAGNLGGACTTSGLAYKLHGRVGDSPIVGAGLYVDNEIGAATATGVGEEVIRIVGSHLVVELMRQGHAPEEACRLAVERIAHKNPGRAREVQVGFLALRRDGAFGAFSLQDDFTYAVRTGTVDEIRHAPHLY